MPYKIKIDKTIPRIIPETMPPEIVFSFPEELPDVITTLNDKLVLLYLYSWDGIGHICSPFTDAEDYCEEKWGSHLVFEISKYNLDRKEIKGWLDEVENLSVEDCLFNPQISYIKEATHK